MEPDSKKQRVQAWIRPENYHRLVGMAGSMHIGSTLDRLIEHADQNSLSDTIRLRRLFAALDHGQVTQDIKALAELIARLGHERSA